MSMVGFIPPLDGEEMAAGHLLLFADRGDDQIERLKELLPLGGGRFASSF